MHSSGGLSGVLLLQMSGAHVTVLCCSLLEHGGGFMWVIAGKRLPGQIWGCCPRSFWMLVWQHSWLFCSPLQHGVHSVPKPSWPGGVCSYRKGSLSRWAWYASPWDFWDIYLSLTDPHTHHTCPSHFFTLSHSLSLPSCWPPCRIFPKFSYFKWKYLCIIFFYPRNLFLFIR